MKPGCTILSRKPKESRWNGTVLSHHERNNSRQLSLLEKIMVTVLWDSEGVILVDVLPRGTSITSEAYRKTLDKLKDRIRRVSHDKNPAEVLILHDNARPHTSLRTPLTKLGWTTLPHPPYSPDLAPSLRTS
jgi:transposase